MESVIMNLSRKPALVSIQGREYAIASRKGIFQKIFHCGTLFVLTQQGLGMEESGPTDRNLQVSLLKC